MAEVRLSSVNIPITGNSRKFDRAARSAAESTRRLERRQKALRYELQRNRQAFKTTIIALGSLRSAFGAVIAATGVGAVSRFLSNTAKATAELQNFADQIGVSVTTLQALQRAGGDWNIEAGQINQAMTRFTRVIGEADQGLATYQRIFDQLGVSIRDSRGELRSTEVVFEEFARRLQGVGSESERNALLMQAFGRQGARLGLLFDRVGKEGLESFNKSQKRLGVLTENQVQRQQELNRAINSFGDVLTYQGRALASAVSPEWTDMINKMSEAAPAIANLLEPALRGIVGIAADVVRGLANIATGVNDILVKVRLLDDYNDRFSGVRNAAADLERAINRGARGRGAIPGLADELARQIVELRRDGEQIPAGVLGGITLDNTHLSAAMRRYFNAIGEGSADIQERQAAATRASIDNLGRLRKAIESVLRTQAQARDITLSAYQRGDGAMWRGITAGPDFDAWVKRQEQLAADAVERVARNFRDQLAFQFASSEGVARAGFESAATAPRAGIGAYGGMTGPQLAAQVRSDMAAKRAADAQDKLQAKLERNREVLARMETGFGNFFESIIDGTAKASDAFKSLAADIARAVAQALIIQPLAAAITGGVQSFFNIPTPTGAAQGGNAYGGRSYLVGELGPELFVPQESGRIVPNKAMGGVTVNQHNEFRLFDDTGFDARMATIAPIIEERAMRGTLDALRRPGAQSV